MTKTSVEYADAQITVYPSPCPFQCKYCWASLPLWQYRTKNANPLKEAWKYANAKNSQRIVISFTTDPYQPIEKEKELTREILSILVLNSDVKHDILILTKNPHGPLDRDIDLLQSSHPRVWLGTTLTSTSIDKISDEPNAPSNYARMSALETAHEEHHIKTWVSIEPWIPNLTDPIRIIEMTYSFVDWYVIGKLNYAKHFGYIIPQDYYRKELPKVIEFCEELGINYLIKKELRIEVDGL